MSKRDSARMNDNNNKNKKKKKHRLDHAKDGGYPVAINKTTSKFPAAAKHRKSIEDKRKKSNRSVTPIPSDPDEIMSGGSTQARLKSLVNK